MNHPKRELIKTYLLMLLNEQKTKKTKAPKKQKQKRLTDVVIFKHDPHLSGLAAAARRLAAEEAAMAGKPITEKIQ